ncbi:MAG: efflux RND transporter periplasmic adaptor subunit [Gammaproteobacteria bacterium]|nr:efflux RND transporter periplasmic adaptor subunit [Gammaproteobacteria bacterium]
MKRFVLVMILLAVGVFVGANLEYVGGISTRIFDTTHKMTEQEAVEGLPSGAVTSEAPTKQPASQEEDRKILYWGDSMLPDYRSDKPGKSPMGMDLVPVYADGEEGQSDNGLPLVTIAPEVVNNLGVRTAEVVRGPLSRQIETVGYLDYDETMISHVHLRGEGWIQRLLVKAVGDPVKQGQLLFELYSPTLVVAQEEYVLAMAMNDEKRMNASKLRLTALGVSQSQIESLTKTRKAEQTVQVYSPQNGVLTALNIREGMHVTPATEVMSVADLSHIWLLAEVFEHQASWVKPGQRAEARLPSMPDGVWVGKVDYIYPNLDAMTRTLRVRLRFDNPDVLLKPNMFAHVSISGGEKEDVLRIPREALIRDGASERVILALGEGRFRPQKVEVGIESEDWVEIRSGLTEGEMVVVSAQFLIDSEASLKASLGRLQPPQETMSEDKASLRDERVLAVGTVNRVIEDGRKLNIQHEPIPELGWPGMTMEFQVADTVDLTQLPVGGRVRFALQHSDHGQYVISDIQALASDQQVTDHD